MKMRELNNKLSVLTFRPKCTLAASLAVPWWVTVCQRDRLTDGRTPDRYITLSTDAASVISLYFSDVKYRWLTASITPGLARCRSNVLIVTGYWLALVIDWKRQMKTCHRGRHSNIDNDVVTFLQWKPCNFHEPSTLQHTPNTDVQ